MNKPPINVQDGFLFQCLKEGRAMSVELVSGRTIEGRIRRFDRFAVVLEIGDRELLVYKHAIASLSTAGEA